ncbi:MAG: AAA family ATPase [Chloroflexi bacterium]|nr:AAA family ATPase [Chloroflexota bacterium]
MTTSTLVHSYGVRHRLDNPHHCCHTGDVFLDQARARLFESLCQLILGLTVGPRPGILCLDDLHWADSATMDWLTYLGRRLRGSQLLVIGTYRGEEVDAVIGLRRGLARQDVLSLS